MADEDKTPPSPLAFKARLILPPTSPPQHHPSTSHITPIDCIACIEKTIQPNQRRISIRVKYLTKRARGFGSDFNYLGRLLIPAPFVPAT
jgi:hypothetical protein